MIDFDKYIISSEEASKVEKDLNKKKVRTVVSDKEQLSVQDKYKLSLCKIVVEHLNNNGLKAVDLAEVTNIPKTRISEIVNYKVTKFTLDKLLERMEVIAESAPSVREHLEFIHQAMNVPSMPVKQFKKLSRDIKAAKPKIIKKESVKLNIAFK